MCTTHAHADAHNSEHAAERVSDHCGHCSGDIPKFKDLDDRRDRLVRDQAVQRDREEAKGLHHTA